MVGTYNSRPVGTRRGRALGALLVSWSLAFWAPGAGVLNAQQQPGLPGSVGPSPGMASTTVPPQLEDVTFAQQLGERLPLDAALLDETGRSVALGEYFGTRPVVLAFVYYQCPMLCSQVMNGLSSSLRVLPFTPGRDFDVVLVSFDPADTPADAAERKRAHLQRWSAEETAPGWHLLTGDEETVRRVASAAGFSYRWDERTGQFAHVSGILVATPDGRLSRYFYGVEYSPRELRMALVESGESRIGSAIDELLLYCFQYDPASGQYGLLVMNLLRLGAVLTVALLAVFMAVMWRRESQASVEGRA